uniref:Tetraspanin-5-like n=1 Tax=Oncorhynchus kisutch TaxID=8019 RepID=A0A8C7I5S1_ONCKI
MMSGKHFKAHEVSCCIKYFIFGFNIIFWLLGVAFLGIGLWAWSEKGVLSNISSITDLGGFDPVWLFLVVGGVMFILGFAGCIGALRENSFLLKFFSVFLGIIFFLELTAGVLAFVFKDWIKDQLNFFINNNIRAYRDDIDLQNLIDFTQEYWECCGAFGADDWNLNIYFNCTDSNPSREKCGVPFSCCTKDPAEDVINTQCGYDIRAKAVSEQRTFIYIKGCVPQFEKWLQDNLTVVAGIFIGIALLQVGNTCLMHKPQILRRMNPGFTWVSFHCIWVLKLQPGIWEAVQWSFQFLIFDALI